MRTFFPTASSLPERPLRRALILSGLLVVVWAAIVLLPGREAKTQDWSEPAARAVGAVTAADTSSGVAAAALPASLSAAERTAAQPPSRSLIGPGYLFAMLILAVGAAWAFWLRRRTAAPSAPQRLREVGRLRTGPQQNLHLVACADEILLIGATPGQVTLLKAYPAGQFGAASPVRAEMMAPSRQPRREAPERPVETAAADEEMPEWTVATASALDEGPDFMTVLRRYAGSRSYRANKLYPSRSGSTPT